MTEKRYTVKTQDNFFAVVDNYSEDKRCIINGIHTKIEAEWLCDEMNELNDENKDLKQIQQDYEDNVSNWFIENWQSLTDEQRQTAHLELGIELEEVE